MNIRKVLKNYFIFTMLIAGSILLSQNPSMQTYYANVFSILDEVSYMGLEGSSLLNQTQQTESLKSETDNRQTFSEKYDLELKSSSEDSFIFQGEKSKKLMDLIFTGKKNLLNLNFLYFKIVGIESDLIENAVLKKGQEIVSVAKILGDKLMFERINEVLNPNEITSLTIELDISKYAGTGTRFRLDLIGKEEIGIFDGDMQEFFKAIYPIRSQSLSVVKKSIE